MGDSKPLTHRTLSIIYQIKTSTNIYASEALCTRTTHFKFQMTHIFLKFKQRKGCQVLGQQQFSRIWQIHYYVCSGSRHNSVSRREKEDVIQSLSVLARKVIMVKWVRDDTPSRSMWIWEKLVPYQWMGSSFSAEMGPLELPGVDYNLNIKNDMHNYVIFWTKAHGLDSYITWIE